MPKTALRWNRLSSSGRRKIERITGTDSKRSKRKASEVRLRSYRPTYL